MKKAKFVGRVNREGKEAFDSTKNGLVGASDDLTHSRYFCIWGKRGVKQYIYELHVSRTTALKQPRLLSETVEVEPYRRKTTQDQPPLS